MRASTAILILSACALHDTRALNTITNLLDCAFTLGPVKCMNALTAWRAKRALKHPNTKSNLTQDLQQFPWIKYQNETEEELYSEMCEGTERLLQKRSLTLSVISGYKLELLSKGNGTLNVDVIKNAEPESGRGSMKKAKKKLSQFLPFIVLPGLIMSAILPFVLPALKLMIAGVGMLNNMALTGAVFTLLRNNAFNDHYEHKVIYVNEGYKNEKHTHGNFGGHGDFEEFGDHEYLTQENHDFQFAESRPVQVPEMETIEEIPLQRDWINQYYGNGQNKHLTKNINQLKRNDRLQLSPKLN